MSRVLLVEDCAEHRSIVDRALRDFCTVVSAPSVADARERMRLEIFDLILMDVELPDGSGFDLCSTLKNRSGGPKVPVVFLTGKATSEEVLFGFMAGGTDYIVKPFHPAELRARIQARLRHQETKQEEWLFSGNLRFNLIRREVQMETALGFLDLKLTPSEFRLLCQFARHPSETMSRARILVDVWGSRATAMSNRAIDVHICQLRKKLPPGPCRIDAVYGAGYRYTDGNPVEPTD